MHYENETYAVTSPDESAGAPLFGEKKFFNLPSTFNYYSMQTTMNLNNNSAIDSRTFPYEDSHVD